MRSSRFLLLSAGLLISLASCVSLETMAPPVTTLLGPSPSPRGQDLQQGREIYLGKCTKCHSPEPIHDYSAREWETDILPAMNKKTKLSPPEAAALHGYIQLVLSSAPRS